jgi:Tn3 transposase DDE domain
MIANATLAARQAWLWGEGSTAVASDSTHFKAWDQNIFTEWHSHYRNGKRRGAHLLNGGQGRGDGRAQPAPGVLGFGGARDGRGRDAARYRHGGRGQLRPPGEHERGFFGLSDKALVAIFELQRTSYGEDGKPIRFALTVYPADRNQFEMEAGRVPARTRQHPTRQHRPNQVPDGKTNPPGTARPDDKAPDSAAGS